MRFRAASCGHFAAARLLRSGCRPARLLSENRKNRAHACAPLRFAAGFAFGECSLRKRCAFSTVHAEIEPMDAVTLDINQLTTMPEGWKMDELYVKAPIATYPDFKKEILSELGSAFGIPYAIVAGTSAGYTYASAKLDHQTYYRSIWTERAFVEDQILNRLFVLWFREWHLSNPTVGLADAMTPWHGHWIWPHTDDLDKLAAPL